MSVISNLSTFEKDVYKKIRDGSNNHLASDALNQSFSGVKTVKDIGVAINKLLQKNLVQLKTDKNDKLTYHAVSLEEAKQSADVKDDPNSAIVLGIIRDAGNLGAWQTIIRKQTNIAQTLLQRCLRSLTNKGLIKQVDNVKFPTRKTFMMADIMPSVELTGGPWYDGNELDLDFINQLLSTCENIVFRKSFPKGKNNPIFPPAHTSKLPSPADVLDTIKRMNVIQNVDINVEHIMQIMNVLVYDGKVEVIKLSSKAMNGGGNQPGWSNEIEQDGGGMDTDEERADKKRRKSGKRSRSSDEDSDDDTKRSRKKKRRDDSDEEDGSDEERAKRKKKKQKEKEKAKLIKEKEKKKRKKEKEKEKERKRKEKRRARSRSKSKSRSRKGSDDDSDDNSDSDGLKTIDEITSGSSKSKKSKKKRDVSSDSGSDTDDSSTDSDSSDSDSDSDSGSDVSSSDIDNDKFKLNSGKAKAVNGRVSKEEAKTAMFDSDAYDPLTDQYVVYRAVRQSQLRVGTTEAPCGGCPQFSFCSEDGPVNPKGCEYYDQWLEGPQDLEEREREDGLVENGNAGGNHTDVVME